MCKAEMIFRPLHQAVPLLLFSCLPPHLSLQTFQKLYNLPHPMPDEHNECHHKVFQMFLGK